MDAYVAKRYTSPQYIVSIYLIPNYKPHSYYTDFQFKICHKQEFKLNLYAIIKT